MKRSIGFTLIELLIVVAIIAILAAIAVPNFLEAQVRAKISRCKSDMRSIATALESYRIDRNRYPPQIDLPGTPPRQIGPAEALRMLTTPVAYMTSMPDDPFFSAMEPDPWWRDNGYYYHVKFWIDLQSDPSGEYWERKVGPENIMREWMLMSLSTDKLMNWENADDEWTEYDGTNGTMSIGDIHRFGP